MASLMDEDRPIFMQIAERIEDDIIKEILLEEEQVPSTNQFASFYKINPATAAKGVNLLVEQQILYKRRGIGMFVSTGARKRLLKKRQEQFYADYIQRMLLEAESLGITVEEIIELIRKGERSK